MKQKNHPFGSTFEAFMYPTLILLAMWLVFWAEQLFSFEFTKLGVLPRSAEGLKGIIFMPLIHSENEIEHIVNNSVPTFFLFMALVYFYREIAFKVFFVGWILTGISLWFFATNKGAYHIGMSGLVYMLAGFLFTSGVLRKFLPLQAISLFVVFLYGSMIWGIFPMQEKVSWEGHFMGMCIGVLLAFWYKENGPQRPKYQYEIEKEMGIEPPDFEGMWNEKVRLAILAEEEQERIRTELERAKNEKIVIYHYSTTKPENKPQDESEN